jgi:hypothetical protein
MSHRNAWNPLNIDVHVLTYNSVIETDSLLYLNKESSVKPWNVDRGEVRNAHGTLGRE